MTDLYQDFSYVYLHRCPETDEVFYCGHGTKARAWRCDTYESPTRCGHRSKKHSDFLNSLMVKGFCPDDWVEIVDKGLSKKDACLLERMLICYYEPRFNKKQGQALLKLDKR